MQPSPEISQQPSNQQTNDEQAPSAYNVLVADFNAADENRPCQSSSTSLVNAPKPSAFVKDKDASENPPKIGVNLESIIGQVKPDKSLAQYRVTSSSVSSAQPEEETPSNSGNTPALKQASAPVAKHKSSLLLKRNATPPKVQQ